jgi:hypothetical protein
MKAGRMEMMTHDYKCRARPRGGVVQTMRLIIMGSARPTARLVRFTTGYSHNAIVHHGRLDAGVRLLQKPFTFDQLASRVREVLDEP